MQPAFSVIFFTVASGAGLGLLALTALLHGAGLLGVVPQAGSEIVLRGAVAGIALTSAGLASSTLHLANPRNAWRSAARFRTSWLSREAVFALALLLVATGYAAALWLRAGAVVQGMLALLVCVLAWTVVICTAMIYASLKPVRQWHTRLTPASYLALAHWSGALVLLAIVSALARDGGEPRAVLPTVLVAAGGLGVASLLLKVAWWRRAAGTADSRTLEQAIGVEHGVRPPGGAGRSVVAARLFDVGHTQGTFLTREFLRQVGPERARAVRVIAVACAFVLPLALLLVAGAATAAVQVATIVCLVGLVAERWLFFVEARHTVRLYHGERRT